MVAEEGRAAFVVGAEGRLVLVHLDFFLDDLLLRVEVGLPQRRAEDVGQDFRRPRLVLRQHRGVVDGRLLGGGGVGAGADLVQLAVDVVGRARGRALEGHVLEEMAHAGDVVGFVAGAGLDDEAQGGRVGLGVAFGDDFQTVGQGVGEELHGCHWRKLGFRIGRIGPIRPILHACSSSGPTVTIVNSPGGFAAR